MQNSAELQAVNERLERGEGWIGYLFTKKDGVKVPSKFLYIQFYAGDEQKRINTKTNEGDNRRYTGLYPHDFRRSASRNLIKAGVPRGTAMLITGHKTESIFERYNIKDTADAEAALMKVGQYSSKKVAGIR